MKIKDFLIEKESFLDKDPDYQIRKVTNKYYQVTKWGRGKAPKEVYDVYENPNGWKCNCAVRGVCKHIKMVKDWIKDGMPNAWDPKDIDKQFKKLLVKDDE